MPCGFSEIFWTFVITTSSGLCLALSRQIYKSKCKQIKCCCLEIDRDVELEEKEDELVITNKIESSKKNVV